MPFVILSLWVLAFGAAGAKKAASSGHPLTVTRGVLTPEDTRPSPWLRR